MIKSQRHVTDLETLTLVQEITIHSLELYKKHPSDELHQKIHYWLEQVKWWQDFIGSCDYTESNGWTSNN